ncbi:hypothetical protein CW304_21490 [Bacillus sp. UFRGS-B20]|nr:hypothetical protein CW304_21490 [Bacillus sp. UFRGS-B20]
MHRNSRKRRPVFPPRSMASFPRFAMNMLQCHLRCNWQYVTLCFYLLLATCFHQKNNQRLKNLFFGFLYKRLQ